MQIKVSKKLNVLEEGNYIKMYEINDNITYEEFYNLLKEDGYLIDLENNNSVWVLKSKCNFCIFSYYLKTEKMIPGLVEKNLKKILRDNNEVYFICYSDASKWKDAIIASYSGNMKDLWHDGWLSELNYCDEVMAL